LRPAGENAKVNIHLPSRHNTSHDIVDDNRVERNGDSIANINTDGTLDVGRDAGRQTTPTTVHGRVVEHRLDGVLVRILGQNRVQNAARFGELLEVGGLC